jgi:hypothetical protein
MTTATQLPPYPTLGLVDGGLTHAARPGAMMTDGFAPALCRSTLYVSVEHILIGTSIDGCWKQVSTPVRATAGTRVTIDNDGNVTGQSVDCLRCSAALERFEAAQ